MTMMEYRAKYEQDELPTMRHVPPLDWVLRKLDEFHERTDKLCWAAFDANRSATEEQREAIERCLRLVVKSLDSLACVARRGFASRGGSAENVRLALDQAFSAASGALRG